MELIENAFNIDFKLPEKMEKDDWETIEYIHEVIKTGSYIGISDRYTITISGKEGLQQILDLVEKNPDQSCSLMMMEKECVAELFGEKLFFGDSKFYPPKLKLESIDELKSQIQFYREGTSVEVHLIPVEDNNYKRIFDKFIKVD